MPPLEDLPAARKRVQEFDRRHRNSVARFWDWTDNVVFKTEKERAADDVRRADPDIEPRQPNDSPHRLTSTVTCLESLLEAPDPDEGADANFTPEWAKRALVDFMDRSLKTTDGWQSDKAAWVYCRVRTLGGALRLIDDGIQRFDVTQRGNAYTLLRQAWDSNDRRGGSFGLQELTGEPSSNRSSGPGVPSDQQYPPNAFLTYWGLLAAKALHQPGQEIPQQVEGTERLAATDWLRANLGFQVALHYGRSSQSDPQQLAWSICGLVRFGSAEVFGNSVSGDRQLLTAGLRAFFEQQRNGTWSNGAPLFHFRSAGNAYTYVYETVAELLSLATSKLISPSTAHILSNALREHSQELMLALDYAEATHQELPDGGWGWSSGHHPHRDSPESWATASVYRFAQALRRLVGIWSCGSAKTYLGARRPNGSLKKLGERGRTWNLGMGTAGHILATSFVHPAVRSLQASDRTSRFLRDPDHRVLYKDQARSAMLFGPPGTGKTTLAESVAGAIGWDFIEITPAQFLDEGVDHVSARADAIFVKSWSSTVASFSSTKSTNSFASV